MQATLKKCTGREVPIGPSLGNRDVAESPRRRRESQTGTPMNHDSSMSNRDTEATEATHFPLSARDTDGLVLRRSSSVGGLKMEVWQTQNVRETESTETPRAETLRSIAGAGCKMEVRLPTAASGLDVIATELDELRETQLQAIGTLNLRLDEINRRMGTVDGDCDNPGGIPQKPWISKRTDDLEKRIGRMESTHSQETTAIQTVVCLLKERMDRFEDRLHDGRSPACSLSSTRDFDSVHTDGQSSVQPSGRATPNRSLEEAFGAATNEDTSDKLFLSRFMSKAEVWNRSVEYVDSSTAGRKGDKSTIEATTKSAVGIDIGQMRRRIAQLEKTQKVNAAVRIQALFRGVTTRRLNKWRFLALEDRKVAKENAKQERLATARKFQQQQKAVVLAQAKKEEDAAIRQKLQNFELKWRSTAASRIQARFRGMKVRAAKGTESKSHLGQRGAQQRQQQAEARSHAKAAIVQRLAAMENRRRTTAALRIQSWLRERRVTRGCAREHKLRQAMAHHPQELPQTVGEDRLQAALEGRLEALEAESQTLRGEFRVLCEEGRLEALEAESETLREEFRVLCDVVDERITTECDALHAKYDRHSETLASWSLGMSSVRKVSDKPAISDGGLLAEYKQSQLICAKNNKKLKAQEACRV